jgi:hypothetical protein
MISGSTTGRGLTAGHGGMAESVFNRRQSILAGHMAGRIFPTDHGPEFVTDVNASPVFGEPVA